jgi:hypothetical protein
MTDGRGRSRRVVTVGIGVVALAGAGTIGWLIGHDSSGGTRVTSLADAIALANTGDLPTGRPTEAERERRSPSTASTTPGSTAPLVVRAVVRDKSTQSGHDMLVLATRAGEITLRADQILEVAGLERRTGGAAELPVGAHVLLFQSTFGSGANEANDYRIALLPPGYGG